MNGRRFISTLQPFENAYQIRVNEWVDDGLPNVDSPTVADVLIFLVPQSWPMLSSFPSFVGASMNNEFLSASGITPSIFPPHIPIFSGHFHKPHAITACQGTVKIQYVGSPYQVSLSEAHQAKHLLVLRHHFNSQRTDTATNATATRT